jgi:hypothetical protein
MYKPKSILASLVILTLVSACSQPFINSPDFSKDVQNNSIKNYKPVPIKGVAEFPEIKGFKTKSAIDFFKQNAVIALIDPATNNPIATGVTSDNGLFSIYPETSFIPQEGAIYILEASKRFNNGASGKTLSSIRSYVQLINNVWYSITFPSLKITSKTTALAVISGLNPTTINPSDVINKIDVSTVSNTFLPFTGVTLSTLNNVSDLVVHVLENYGDPIKRITLNNNIYSIFAEDDIPLPAGSSPVPTPTPISTPTPVPGPEQGILLVASGGGEIQTFDMDGNIINSHLTDTPWPSGSNLMFSPDGLKILFNGDLNNSSPWMSEVSLINADGTNLNHLTNGAAVNKSYGPPEFSPDGSKIITTQYDGTDEEIVVMNANGSNPVFLTSNTEPDTYPTWSADGTKIAFYRGWNQLWVMNSDGSNQTQIPMSGQPDPNNPVNWSPTGSKIVFSCYDNDYNICTVNSDGSDLNQLTNGGANFRPQWSPDGTKILYYSSPDFGNFGISMVDANGGNEQSVFQPSGGMPWEPGGDSASEQCPFVWKSDKSAMFFATQMGSIYRADFSPQGNPQGANPIATEVGTRCVWDKK